jgi:hypothetical protein
MQQYQHQRQRRILERVSTHMKNKGRHVRTLPAETFTAAA